MSWAECISPKWCIRASFPALFTLRSTAYALPSRPLLKTMRPGHLHRSLAGTLTLYLTDKALDGYACRQDHRGGTPGISTVTIGIQPRPGACSVTLWKEMSGCSLPLLWWIRPDKKLVLRRRRPKELRSRLSTVVLIEQPDQGLLLFDSG